MNIGVGAEMSNMSSPTIPSTYNGGGSNSNFNATGNARDHGIGRQSPNSFGPGITGMSSQPNGGYSAMIGHNGGGGYP